MYSGFDFHNVNVVSFNGRNRLTSIVKYIDCTDFVNDSVEVNMGRGEVFFENTDGYVGEGTLNAVSYTHLLYLRRITAFQVKALPYFQKTAFVFSKAVSLFFCRE